MAKSFDPRDSGYVDVAQRIQEFYKGYPEGALCTTGYEVVEAGGQAFVAVTAFAYRSGDDDRPGVGVAWEPVPGRTPYTKDSELMNAETSAWGRAIASLGFATNHIASANEVRNRQANGTSNIDIPTLSRTLKDMGIESPKSFIAEVTGASADKLEKVGEAKEAIVVWASEEDIDDPVQELIELAANKKNPFHTEDSDWTQHEMEKDR